MWCLGDIVGYGPDPHDCIEAVRQTSHVSVAGNHDWAAIGKIDTDEFNPAAAAACQWTARQLTSTDVDYLSGLPLTIEQGDFTLVHGSPREPIWEYLLSTDVAKENFAYFKSPFCLVGHSHVPLVFSYTEDGTCSLHQFTTNAGPVLGKTRLIINPGGVGQPRDGDPRASYAMYDSEARQVSLCRVPYDIRVTQERMMKHRLPASLIARLSYGL